MLINDGTALADLKWLVENMESHCSEDQLLSRQELAALLKAVKELQQEPVKPIKPRGSALWICGACKKAIGTSLIYCFCPWCGKEVMRDG